MALFQNLSDAAMNEAAKAVRGEMLRHYVEGDADPDGEDKAIAVAAVTAWLGAMLKEMRSPEAFAETAR